ncbi:hypothetical protein Leryth_025310 [Lithospermum erythrorhizon]|nr:hypothetical protein Leryth_025310 [Lithospermum erythrorhizon]
MVRVLEGQIKVEEECASLLEMFAMDAADNAALVMKNAEAMFSIEMEDWLSSSEAVDTKKIELEIESHIMNDTRSNLDNLIEDSLGDDHREKEILYKRKEALTEELEKLLALVKEKEAEIAETNFNIENVEKKIAGTVTGFEEVQSSVNTKYDELQSALLQVERDDESLTKRKEEIDAHLSLEEHRGSKIKELSRSSLDEANAYLEDVGVRKSLLQVVIKFKEDKEKLAKTEEKLSEDVQSLKHEISAARSSIQDLSSTKSSIQQEIESIKHRLIFIDKRAPELEAEKKVAAGTRNFKEAARVAAEVKALSVEREELQVKVEAMVLDLRKLEENISSTIDIVRATEEQMELKEKEFAIARFQRLTLVAGSAAAERSAALELGDTGEADILLMESESANTEATKLQNMYAIKDDEVASLSKHFISSELLSKLHGKQLEVLAESSKIEEL